MQLVKAKQSKKKNQISKFRSAIQKAKQIKPTQIRNAINKLLNLIIKNIVQNS